MQIRVFTEADVEDAERLLAMCPEAAQWSPAEMLRNRTREQILWAAGEQGLLAGIIVARVVAAEAEILNLAVSPAFRRRGVGRLLLAAATASIAAQHATRIFLEVRESNASARAFYRAFGFGDIGRRKQYYRDPMEDALVLSRNLT